MRITDIRVYVLGLGFRNGIFTEIETDSGITGVSETVMKRRSRTIETYIGELGRYLRGQDPTRIEDHFEKLYRDSFWVGGPMHATAISAVELALWDIVGKELGVPVYRLLGGPTRDRVLVYAHCAGGATPVEFARSVKQRQEQGFKAVKTTLPIFYGTHPKVEAGQARVDSYGYSGSLGVMDRSLKETEYLPANIFKEIAAFFAATRDAVGPEMGLAVDCHGRFNPSNALRLAEALAPYDLMFIEEPVPPENPDAMAWVTARSPVPIAAGERLVTVYDAAAILEKQGIAVLQPDVVNCGGLSQARKMAAVAEAHYVGIAPHNPNGPLCTAASVHLAASIPNFLILETVGSPEDAALFREVVSEPLEIVDGYIQIPVRPGLGMEINHAAIDRYPYQAYEGYR